MKYQKIIDKVRGGGYTRAGLIQLRINVEAKVRQGDRDAEAVLEAIDRATPSDSYIVFMGFCPGADFANRLDVAWKANGVCTFVFHESDQQSERFNDIWPGDLIVLKKRQRFGETMQLYGHGRVTGIRHDTSSNRYLEMDWSPQETIIEVPLLGCNSTVDVRAIERVEAEMSDTFFAWLGEPPRVEHQ
jgi:hypothetical protein